MNEEILARLDERTANILTNATEAVVRLGKLDERLNSQADRIDTLYAIVLGNGSDKGLVGKVDCISEKHSKLSDWVKILSGILIGSGIIGGSLLGVSKLFSG